jgi:hypothetical protein
VNGKPLSLAARDYEQQPAVSHGIVRRLSHSTTLLVITSSGYERYRDFATSNALNVLFLDEIIAMFIDRGWTPIDAYSDVVYDPTAQDPAREVSFGPWRKRVAGSTLNVATLARMTFMKIQGGMRSGNDVRKIAFLIARKQTVTRTDPLHNLRHSRSGRGGR